MKRFTPLLAAFALTLALLAPAASAQSARRTLGRVLPEVKFDGVALEECIDFLRDVSGANIHVNWRALEASGITQDTPVTLRLRSVSIAKVLSLLLNEAGGGDTLAYDMDENVISITTKEQANQRLITRIYPVDDLLMEIPDFTDAPEFSLESSNDRGGGSGGGGGGGGQGIFGNQNDQDDEEEETKTKEERADDLVNLIKDVIEPDIWRDNGGIATIRYFQGNLIVMAPRSVHEQIGGYWD